MQAATQCPAPRWTVVIPYFNEAAFLPATLESLGQQTLRPFRLVLVDNGSIDGSPALAAAWAAAVRPSGIDTLLLSEPTPGQVHALAAGIAVVDSEFIAIADADTFYPPDYLATATRLMDAAPAGTIGFIAHDARGDAMAVGNRARRWLYSHVMPWLLPRQAHGGGYGHLFRTAPYKASGGYSPTRWPYVLKDHELVNRLWKQGRIAMHPDLWVRPSDRRADRAGVRWSLVERIIYHASPPFAKDWFWYRFMAGRFARRRMEDTVLRQRRWEADQPPT